MKKKIIFATTLIGLVTFTMINPYTNNKNSHKLLLVNVEALADNTESATALTCLGIFGWCSYDCPKCGVGWGALGSTMVGVHKCSTTK